MNKYYIAGLFDGEGWFQIARVKGVKSRTNREFYFQGYAQICMREQSILSQIQAMYGGSLSLKKARKSGHSDAYQLTLTCRNLDKFIKDMDGIIIGKNKQLQVMKKFRKAAKAAFCLRMTDQRFKLYTDCFFELRTLNKKGVGKT